jgi:hypothetical protein
LGCIHRTSEWEFIVFNAAFNYMSVTSWRSAILLEEIGENHRPVTSHVAAEFVINVIHTCIWRNTRPSPKHCIVGVQLIRNTYLYLKEYQTFPKTLHCGGSVEIISVISWRSVLLVWFGFIVFNTTFSNISVMSWRSD